MSIRTQYASFLIRLWRYSDPDQDGAIDRWQGEVENIQSGKTWSYNTREELSLFLQQAESAEGVAWIELQEAESPGLEDGIQNK